MQLKTSLETIIPTCEKVGIDLNNVPDVVIFIKTNKGAYYLQKYEKETIQNDYFKVFWMNVIAQRFGNPKVAAYATPSTWMSGDDIRKFTSLINQFFEDLIKDREEKALKAEPLEV